MFGFSWCQSKDAIEQKEKDEAKKKELIAEQERLLLEQAELQASADIDSLKTVIVSVDDAAQTDAPVQEVAPVPATPFKDTLLNKAYHYNKNYEIATEQHVIANDLVTISFNRKGAQPLTVKFNDYTSYNLEDPKTPTELYFMRKGSSVYDVIFNLNDKVAATEKELHTKDFIFEITDTSATHVVMKLDFEGGYIQQKYWLDEGDYMLKNELTVNGVKNLVADSTKAYDTDWKFNIPRLEKSYTNEKRYSKLDYYHSGESDPEEFAEGENGAKTVGSSFEWFAFQQQFFSAIMTPKNGFMGGSALGVTYASEKDYETKGKFMDCWATLKTAFDVTADDEFTSSNTFYFGPNDYRTLESYDRNYERIIPLGGWMVSWFNRWVIIPVFDFLGKHIDNYGIIILILTLLVKLLLSPLTTKSYKSTAKMQALKPEIQQINERYPKKEDAMKKQQAMMNLYQKAGVSPMGGCLPMLLQMPILFAMFRFFPASIQLRQEGFLWADDLSSYDSAISFGSNIPLLGDHISIFALLMAVSMFVYSKMNSAQMGDNGMPGMKFMSLYLMPIMMFFICNSLPAALSYYYFLSNLITMGMTWYIRKYVVTEEKVRAEMARAALKPRKKSKWQMRLEEAQRMQEQMQKEKKNRRR